MGSPPANGLGQETVPISLICVLQNTEHLAQHQVTDMAFDANYPTDVISWDRQVSAGHDGPASSEREMRHLLATRMSR